MRVLNDITFECQGCASTAPCGCLRNPIWVGQFPQLTVIAPVRGHAVCFPGILQGQGSDCPADAPLWLLVLWLPGN